ncbi:MAG: nitrous oxide reductase accessory protein NosL [Desulfobacterales bacterium]|nr:MAG: nitrous oxide reductase accessory protein NosL [Desulfobacterales bacterium]
MKKAVSIGLLILLVTGFTGALAQEDIAKHASCSYCGMDRAKFAHSRVYVEYDDGSTVGTCSLHCAALDLALNIDKTPKTIQVGDYNTQELIDAAQAFWIIGGSKMGVMTKRAKWAFKDRADAEQFAQQNGGDPIMFEAVMQAAYEDMYLDTRMIREKRKMMRMKMKPNSPNSEN